MSITADNTQELTIYNCLQYSLPLRTLWYILSTGQPEVTTTCANLELNAAAPELPTQTAL